MNDAVSDSPACPAPPSVCGDLRHAALRALAMPAWPEKLRAVDAMPLDAPVDTLAVLADPGGLPGRPARPELVSPSRLKPRPVGTPEGRAALIHALAHIEFNAVNLALDIAWRFAGMPADFYRDWLRVAQEESRHFQLLDAHLGTLGHAYGDFPAHNGLWEMAEKTRGDLAARLTLVPRVLEARGLDASPQIRDKLLGVGDRAGAAILEIILREEIGHVAVGNRWWRHLCAAQGKDSVAWHAELAARHAAPRQRGPFNLEARRAAGFDDAELDALAAPAAPRVSPWPDGRPGSR
ncbi:ferritin-like domain-containing protein [Bordetella bronchialis]|uniref:ferritin-like domain-containing protein n=1 Tax=Bordetella bronchialis TaxID=463025 RepID=UPI003D081F8C